eukprot:GHVS01077186.1.p1 GENE.GHVS01077186.1~~GHVS01077186.1.p1  ORF type:complete len:815 (-),score=155.46 GHVS01077186.1:241-2397(-)
MSLPPPPPSTTLGRLSSPYGSFWRQRGGDRGTFFTPADNNKDTTTGTCKRSATCAVVSNNNKPSIRKLHWVTLDDSKIGGTIFDDIANELKYTDNVVTAKTNVVTSCSLLPTAATGGGRKKSVGPLGFCWLADKQAVERVFSQKQKHGKSKYVISALNVAGRSGRVKVIDARTSQRVAIAMSKFKMPVETLVEKLTNYDSSGLEHDDLDPMLQTVLSAEVVNRFKSALAKGYHEDDFRQEEKSILPLMRLARPTEQCRLLLIDLAMPHELEMLERSCDVLKKACNEARNCEKLRAVMRAVLVWGNFVNFGCDSFVEMRAKGFALTTLTKMSEYRSPSNSKMTALHFVVANVISADPELHLDELSAELPSLPAAAAMAPSFLADSLKTINEEIAVVREEVFMQQKGEQQHEGDDNVVVVEVSRRPDLFVRIEQQISKLEDTLSRTVKELQSICGYFGIETEHVDADHQTASSSSSGSANPLPPLLLLPSFPPFQEVFKPLDSFRKAIASCLRQIQMDPAAYEEVLVGGGEGLGHLVIRAQRARPVRAAYSTTGGIATERLAGSEGGRGADGVTVWKRAIQSSTDVAVVPAICVNRSSITTTGSTTNTTTGVDGRDNDWLTMSNRQEKKRTQQTPDIMLVSRQKVEEEEDSVVFVISDTDDVISREDCTTITDYDKSSSSRSSKSKLSRAVSRRFVSFGVAINRAAKRLVGKKKHKMNDV